MSKPEVEVGAYHIHSDAFGNVSEEFEKGALALGFEDTSFNETADGFKMFVPVGPKTMFSYFTDDKIEFNEKWTALAELGKKTNFVGYMEGEYGEPYHFFESKPFNPDVQFPFKISRRKTKGGIQEPFRETEFHLEFDYDASNPELIKKFKSSGLYGALYSEPEGYRSMVLTIQGTNKEIIPLQVALTDYLNEAGGIEKANITKEDVREHIELNVNPEDLPEVVHSIEWL